MKRIFAFLRSMKFGVALMVLVIIFSLAGSLLIQGQTSAWYAQRYPNAASIILTLGLDHVFSVWYFLLLMGLLCVNLTLCSLIRFSRVRRLQKKFYFAAGEPSQAGCSICALEEDKLRAYLIGRHYRLRETEGAQIFYKNMAGYYGSFTVHLAILLTLVFGAMTLRMSSVSDRTIMPGDSLTLADGTVLAVDSFRITDETGRLDFVSDISVTAPDGAQSGLRQIAVNRPFSFRSYKFYQHTYGTAGSVTVANEQTGGTDVFSLDEPCFLSIDGRNGIWYQALYPGYVRDEEGHFTLITSTSGVYTDPIYQILVSGEGEMTPVLALPGETIRIEDVSFTFNEPVAYPGIRIKHMPALLLALLYSAFGLMVLGFWLCFFHMPAIIAVRRGSYELLGPKNTGVQLEIDILLQENG